MVKWLKYVIYVARGTQILRNVLHYCILTLRILYSEDWIAIVMESLIVNTHKEHLFCFLYEAKLCIFYFLSLYISFDGCVKKSK